MMNKLPTVSEKEMLILQILIKNNHDLYGFEIVDQSNEQITIGSVYVMLHRMERKKKIIESYTEKEPEFEGAKPRRYYKVTALGQKIYKMTQDLVTPRAEKARVPRIATCYVIHAYSLIIKRKPK